MSEPGTNSSPSERGFWSLIVTQFQNAFSDNALRNLVIFLIVGAGLSPAERGRMVLIIGTLFSAPFILFSMAGGFLADRFSKRAVTIGTKLSELPLMLLVIAGLALNLHGFLLLAIFLMGVRSALFGPAKYGLLPELLPPRRLSWGNGVLELGTFVAIILGTVAGGWLCETFRGRQIWSGAALLAVAVAGLAASFGISRVPAADPAKKFHANFLADLFAQVRLISGDRVLWLSVLGNTYFWFLGMLLQLNIVFLGTDVLQITATQISYLMAVLAIGIGVGSFAAGYLSGGKIEYGLIPLGSVGLCVFGVALAQPGLTAVGVGAALAAFGFFAGFFAVPVNALIQHRPDPARKGGVLAAANLLSFVGIFAASGVYFLLTSVGHLSPRTIFALSAAATFAGTVYVLVLLPDALLRLVFWMLTRTIYRLRVLGRDNIPERGGVLFVCNHLSFVDALLLNAATDRPIRFIMFKGIYDHPLVRPVARIMRAIPISSQLRPRDMIKSLREATEAIKAGEVVCIFAEGQITRIGQLLPFRRGFERIMHGVDAPIIPVALDGVWGSIFSFEKGRFVWKLPHRVPYPVAVSFGAPLPPTATPFEVRQVVQEMQSEAWQHRRRWMQQLQRKFVRGARLHPWRFAMADGRTPRVTAAAALTRTVYLARRLRKVWDGQEMVGILLPPSVAGALVNWAALLMGKVPVNLNYTVSNETLASCARQCNLKTVVTSREFLERVKFTVPAEAVFIEDIAAKPTAAEKLAALALAWTLPARLLERAVGRRKKITLDDFATVIFSSGSTGDPKGVMLTHYNVCANVQQLGQTFAFDGTDRVLGILPFFHSFGFTGALILPATLGTGVVYHPSPLDARAIGALTAQYGVTFLLATPTFLQMYMRGCSPEDFGSLRFVMTGAEKLPERLAQAFEDRFGIRPMEGYGCTECSPAVTVNTRDFRAAGFRQVGAKRGTIGHPLPGVSVRIVDPDTLKPVPTGQPGLMLIRGPNVMFGYLGRPEKTAEVLRDAWYVTGDIATEDEDGFIQITDRLSRFSKIGGEMVPHVKVEEKLHELAGVTEQTFVVTGVPDEKKGERLVVLHTLPDDKLQPVLDKLPQSGLPNLWLPRTNQFFRVESFPHLGTGKLDLRKIREISCSASCRE
jgi:acyl-[acyl-carrier-protein]-phospholipid O-acyltransferase/long-chain-fatty-acid--[acyl-carrier-protein] ligase